LCGLLPWMLHAQPISLDMIALIIFNEACKLWSSSLRSLLQPPATSSFLGPNVLLSSLFENTFNLCCSCSMRDKISYPYKITGKVVFMHILIFKFLQRIWEDNSKLNVNKHSPHLIWSSFLHESHVLFVTVVSSIWSLPYFQRIFSNQ
jgi:hypothetical protein